MSMKRQKTAVVESLNLNPTAVDIPRLAARCFSFAVVLISSFAAVPVLAQSFELPVDTSLPVITLNHVGGNTVLPRQNQKPELTIRGDGTITVSDSLGRGKDLESRISDEDLHRLMTFVLNEEHFPEFDAGDAQFAINAINARCGHSLRVTDAASTVIHVHLANEDFEGNFYALGVFAEAYPIVKPLGRLWKVERRLRQLAEEIKAGGKDTVTSALDVAASYIQQQTDPFDLKLEDYAQVLMNGDNNKVLEFVHDRGDGTSTSVIVTYNLPQSPTVSMRTVRNLQPELMTCPQVQQ
jgi:hypothetical protein